MKKASLYLVQSGQGLGVHVGHSAQRVQGNALVRLMRVAPVPGEKTAEGNHTRHTLAVGPSTDRKRLSFFAGNRSVGVEQSSNEVRG